MNETRSAPHSVTVGRRKSSHSAANNECVEVAQFTGHVGIRDSKISDRDVVTVDVGAFSRFVMGLKRGSGQPPLPPSRTIGELRAALASGYGFLGDADDFETELAHEMHHADPADPSGVIRLVEEFRGRITARQDPAFGASVAAAVSGIRAARGPDSA